MNQLYNEIIQIKRRLMTGKMKYFGEKYFGDASCYTVMLKNGSYFHIDLGTDYIPKFSKKDVLFIFKEFSRRSNTDSFKYGWRDFQDSDRGRTRAYINKSSEHTYNNERMYVSSVMKKNNISYNNEIFTGYCG